MSLAVRGRQRSHGQPIRGPLQGQSNLILNLAFTADGGRLLSAAKDRVIEWEVSRGTARAGRLAGTAEAVSQVAFSPDGNSTVWSDGSVLLIRTGTVAPPVRFPIAMASADEVQALVVATVGLSNPSAAGLSARAAWLPATINTIAVVDADPEPAALVNLVVTLTEVKTDVLRAAGVRCDDGRPATGTSSDAVVVAATGRGARCRYGGPVTDVGWAAAHAARQALEMGVRRWLAEHPQGGPSK